MKKRNVSNLSVIVVTILLTGCGAAPLKDNHGQTVYTKIGMWVSNGAHLTTNYNRGTFIPANTKLTIASSYEDSIRLRISNKRMNFKIYNNRQHTNLDIHGIFRRYLSEDPINKKGFKDFELEAIENGEIQTGMSKKAVLMARGFPPAHRTPSINRDQWIYWQRSMDRISVEFEEDKVAYVID